MDITVYKKCGVFAYTGTGIIHSTKMRCLFVERDNRKALLIQ